LTLRSAASLVSPAIPLASAAVVAACAVVAVAMTMRMIIASWNPAPYWDQWGNLVTGRALSWSWLVEQQNEHRLFVPRLVFWLDRQLAAETGIVDLAVSVLMQAALALLLAVLALKSGISGRGVKLLVVGLCFVVLFWAVQYENFTSGFQVQFFGVLLAAAGAFAMVAVGPASGLGVAAATGFSGAAAYTSASGVLVAPLALLLGLWVRRPRSHLLFLLIAAIAWPASYLWGYVRPPHNSEPPFFSNTAAIGFHLLVQIGAPLFNAIRGHHDIVVAALLGGMGMSLFLAALTLVGMRAGRPSQKALAMFGIYLLGSAALTASGRAAFGAPQALSSRYSTPILAFWLSTLLLWLGLSTCRTRLRLVVLGGSVALAIIVVLTEPRFAADAVELSLARKLATPALMAGLPDPRLSNLSSDLKLIMDERSLLLSSRTSVFADDWTRLMGANFAEHFAIRNDSQCSGAFERAEAIDGSSYDWIATGAAWREGGSDGLRRILLVDGDGRVVGYGLGGFNRSSIAVAPDGEADRPISWTGVFRHADPAQVRAYALLDERYACLVGADPQRSASSISAAALPTPAPEPGGRIELVAMFENIVVIAGWGYLAPGDAGRVMIDTDLPVLSKTLNRARRPDVASAIGDRQLRAAGVQIRLALRPDRDGAARHRLCIWTDDPEYGRRLLRAPPINGQPLLVCDIAADQK
jgi:hypothetical protein